MSRSLGGTKVTSFSPISTRPPSKGSRPASIRSAVVFPDPDGPTRTMNSPSLMSRSRASTAGGASFAYTRVADTYFTLAIGDLRPVWHRNCHVSLDGSHGQAADQRPLRDPAHEDHRDRGHRGRRRQVREVQPLLGAGANQEHRHGRGVGDGQVERKEQLGPGEYHADERALSQPEQADRQD